MIAASGVGGCRFCGRCVGWEVSETIDVEPFGACVYIEQKYSELFFLECGV